MHMQDCNILSYTTCNILYTCLSLDSDILFDEVPGSQLLLAADVARRRKHELLSALRRTLDFLCGSVPRRTA